MLALQDSPSAAPAKKPKVDVVQPPKPAKLAWKNVQTTVSDAKAANERLLRDAQRYVQKIRSAKDPGLVSKMTDIHDSLSGNIVSLLK